MIKLTDSNILDLVTATNLSIAKETRAAAITRVAGEHPQLKEAAAWILIAIAIKTDHTTTARQIFEYAKKISDPCDGACIYAEKKLEELEQKTASKNRGPSS